VPKMSRHNTQTEFSSGGRASLVNAPVVRLIKADPLLCSRKCDIELLYCCALSMEESSA
jgi:hypothetical protein